MDNGIEPIDDPDVLARVRRQATSVYLKSLALGLILTLLCLLIP